MNNLSISILRKFKATLLLLFIGWPLLGIAEGRIVSPGKVFVSPDKSKSIKLSDGDFAIKDEKTGDVALIEDKFTPVFAIVWSADSRSIFMAVHVARGLIVQILHFDSNKWNIYTVDGPESRFHDSTLLNWVIKPKQVSLVCKITLVEDNGRIYACYVGTYDVDPTTGESSNLRKKHLNFGECVDLKSKFVPK